MRAQQLYQQLEKDFIHPAMRDDWAAHMDDVKAFLAPQFIERSMGVVCDFATEITCAYTAVFPTREVMRHICDENAHDALLFVHHPSIWNLRTAPQVFYQMDTTLLGAFQKRRIAIYALHVPLDHFGDYSTSVTLARALHIENHRPFCTYYGALAGVFGTTTCATVSHLRDVFAAAVGHDVAVYDYGAPRIADGAVAVVAGDGLDRNVLDDMVRHDVRVLVTGVSAQTEYAAPLHDFAHKHGITILGGTHYSTEKFACMAMREYFAQQHIPSTFVAGVPLMEDL